MKKYYKALVFAAIIISLLGGIFFVSQSSSSTSTVFADGSGSPTTCTENQNAAGTMDGSITGTDNLVIANAPSGKIITGVCIKSGNNMFAPDKHSSVLTNGVYENNCFTVTGVGTSQVRVERTGTPSSTCQEISHIDVIYGTVPTPTPSPTITPSPTPTPTDIPTPTPTDVQLTHTPTPTPTCTGQLCIIVDCPGGGDCEVVIGSPTPSATPSATPTATQPTATPTTVPNNGGNNTGGNNPSNETQGSVQGTATVSGGQVLGASTLAATGTFSLSTLGIILGSVITSVSVLRKSQRA